MASSYVLTKASRVFVLLLDDKVFLNDFDQTQGQNRELSCFIHTKMKRTFWIDTLCGKVFEGVNLLK